MLTKDKIYEVARNITIHHGDFISHSQLNDILQLEKPQLDEDMQLIKYDKLMEEYNFKRMSSIDVFKDAMLEERQMYLKNSRGEGYRVIRPNEHAKESKEIISTSIDKGFAKALDILDHTKITELTITEQTELAETQIRIKSFKNMVDASRKEYIERKKNRIGDS